MKSNLDEGVLEDRSRLEEFCGKFRGREDAARLGLLAVGTVAASYAAVDQYLEGQPELGDFWGHVAAGMVSSLGGELVYQYSGLDEEFDSEVPKYAAMITAGAIGGGFIEAGQLYGEIPGGLDAESYGQTLRAGIYTTIFEFGMDSNQD